MSETKNSGEVSRASIDWLDDAIVGRDPCHRAGLIFRGFYICASDGLHYFNHQTKNLDQGCYAGCWFETRGDAEKCLEILKASNANSEATER